MNAAHAALRLRAAAMRRLFGTVSHVETSADVVALTFDDGPDPTFTPLLLDILAKHAARATFFMIGRQAAKHRELVDKVAASGHAIGNHTYAHPCLPSLPQAARREEMVCCQEILAPYASGLFRPPKGLQSFGSYRDTLSLGLQPIAWNAHAEDWMPRAGDEIAAALAAEVRDGSIVLLHDRIDGPSSAEAADRTRMLEGLELFLSSVKGRFRFVTVPELLHAGKPVRANWFIRTEAEWPLAGRYL